jgi:acetyl esterase/lipase
MTIARTLVFGSLLALGCSSEASGDADGSSPGQESMGPVGPVIAGNPGSNAQAQQPTSSAQPTPQPTSEQQPTSSAQPTSQPTSEQQPTPQLQPQSPPQNEPDPEQQPAAEVKPGSAGVAAPTIPAVTGECPAFQTGTITFMGLSGIQVVAGAKAAAATAPMVFYWHGTGSTSGEFSFMAGAVRDGVQAEGGILVSFQGTTGGDALSGTSVFGKGDMTLVDQLAACAVRDHNVDPRRIFTTGCSAGGLFAGALAALRSEYIAAAAPNSGGFTFPQQFQNDFTPALMTVHGAPGRDVVVVDFSTTSATADKAFKGRGGFVINCNHGGGHCGGAGLAPDIWEFFEAHPYGVEPAPSPWTSGLPSDFSSQCQIF